MATRLSELTQSHKDTLRTSSWLVSRSPDFQQALLNLGHLIELDPGDIVCQRGKPVKNVHSLIEGQVDVQLLAADGEELVYPYSAPGTWYSFSDVITQDPSAGTAIARSKALMQCIPRRAFMAFLDADPKRYKDIISHENALRRNIQNTFVDVVTSDGIDLVARRLVGLLEHERMSSSNSLRIAQSEFAAAVGVSLPTVQRAFRQFKKHGAIETSYGKVVVKDLDKLKSFALRLPE